MFATFFFATIVKGLQFALEQQQAIQPTRLPENK